MAARDNRRIAGPEKSTPIHVLLSPDCSKLLAEDGLRKDKRSPLDVRKMYMGLSNISQAKGSSFVEIGNTKVVCGVYGPREVAPSNTFKATGQVSCEVKLAPFSCRVRRSPLPDRQVRELSTQLKETLEAAILLDHYPKAQVDVYVTVVEDGGGLLAACVNAASLALCDAEIHMYDVVVAASLLWHRGTVYLDPSLLEEDCVSVRSAAAPVATNGSDTATAMDVVDDGHQSNGTSSNSNGCLTVGLMPVYANGQVALMVQSGSVTVDHLQEGLDIALETCRKVYTVVKQVLLSSATKKTNQDENR